MHDVVKDLRTIMYRKKGMTYNISGTTKKMLIEEKNMV